MTNTLAPAERAAGLSDVPPHCRRLLLLWGAGSNRCP